LSALPGIHDLLSSATKDVDGRDKPGHDDLEQCVTPGLLPGIHVLLASITKDVDGRPSPAMTPVA
jgi:hypothetical protein